MQSMSVTPASVNLVFFSMLSMAIVSIFMSLNSFQTLFSIGICLDKLSGLMVWSLCLVLTSIFLVSMSPEKSILLSSFTGIMFYVTSNWVLFFICFEISMIPLFWMILSNSQKPERILASQYLLFYTVLFSFPLFCFILLKGSFESTNSMLIPWSTQNSLWSNLSILAFLVKFPMYLGHSWLLKAHVEAPLNGSMFLAGVLLKFGPYGMIRLTSNVVFDNYMLILIISISLAGSVISAMMVSLSYDVKLSVALTSVSHMNFGLSAIFTMTSSSLSGILLASLAHSLSSCLLFYSVTHYYKQSGSRCTLLVKGVMSWSHIMWLMGGLMWMGNLNLPPFIGFIGEINFIISLLYFNMLTLLMIVLYFMMSSIYSLKFYVIQFNSSYCTSLGQNEISCNYIFQYSFCSFTQVLCFFLVDGFI